MQLGKARLGNGEIRVVILANDHVMPLALDGGIRDLSDILHSDNPAKLAESLIDDRAKKLPVEEVELLAPIDRQEVWAAGVTYKRSQEARERESVGAAQFYDLVYSADRPEIFFKSPAYRVSSPGERVHIRRDSKWSVPEPELALVISPRGKLVGYTIGNDMSSRDIEGENPLYLPQAKFYDHACALGPVVTLVDSMPTLASVTIRLVIEREGKNAFDGSTNVGMMKRTPPDLISWLYRETSFPHGAVLLTGTGVVPPDHFTLAVGDVVHIDIAGIGRLTNRVEVKE